MNGPPYYSETQKIKPKIESYLKGTIIDIGCNRHKITEDALGVDCVPYPGVNHVILTSGLDKLSTGELAHLKGKADVVYSSHCLEHFRDDLSALKDWCQL